LQGLIIEYGEESFIRRPGYFKGKKSINISSIKRSKFCYERFFYTSSLSPPGHTEKPLKIRSAYYWFTFALLMLYCWFTVDLLHPLLIYG
jgi:hypothetical protein